MHRALCQMVQRVRLRTHTIPVLTVRTNLLQMKHSTMFGFLGWQKFCNTRYCWNNADKYSTHLGTIYAVSSGHGKCGVSVVRVSGPQTKEAMLSILQKKILPKPRQAILRRFYHPKRQEPLDRGLLLWFPGPESFTGEDCCEFHVHGGTAVVAAMLDALGAVSGLRHAEAGEFSKRAFQNGKLDLTEVEGLGDLIHAETEAQRKQALRQMEGALSKIYCDWKVRLLKCLANVEAFIDFGEEENIEEGIMNEVKSEVELLKEDIGRHLSDNRRGERLRNGVHVTIVGKPNVGKSSLLNVICQQPAAIVSPIPGTTRDVVERAVDIGGYPVLLSDTAGLRDTADVVEKEGVHRAITRASQADLLILVLDSPAVLPQIQNAHMAKEQGFSLSYYVQAHLTELGIGRLLDLYAEQGREDENDVDSTYSYESNLSSISQNIMVVFNKCDLLPDSSCMDTMATMGSCEPAVCFLSCTTEHGLPKFLDTLGQHIQELCGAGYGGTPSLTQQRHRENIQRCHQTLDNYLRLQQSDIVCAAEELRVGMTYIGNILGHVGSEEILDVIFKDFCIGK